MAAGEVLAPCSCGVVAVGGALVPGGRTAVGAVADGLFLSNGPGDPTDVMPVVEMVRTLRGRLPIFGICLDTR